MMDISRKYHCRIENYRPGGNSDAYIVVHNTGSTATAKEEAQNLANNVQKPSRSFHYVLDGSECYQVVDDTDTAWSVGAWKGCTAYVRHNQSINVEVCSDGAEFTDSEKQQLREVVSMLMQRHNIGAERVVRHWDCHSGRKDCPAYSAGANNPAWNELHAYITGGSDAMPTYTGGSSTSQTAAQEHTGSGFGGTYTCQVDNLNVRTEPSTSAGVVAQYHRGETVNLQDWYVIADGYVWGRYVGGSGNTRYVAVGKPTGGPAADDYLVKGGGAYSAGTYRCTGEGVRVRRSPSLSGEVVAKYNRGEIVRLDSFVDGDGLTWGSYVGVSGNRNYVAAKYFQKI